MTERVDLTCGSLRLTGRDSYYTLYCEYNQSETGSILIRGEDDLYALQFLINRAISKLEAGED